MESITTLDLYGEKKEVKISGKFKRFDTCLFPLARENHKENGIYTAKEVSKFCNDKTLKDGVFGFVFVKKEGNKITWYDDQPYNVSIDFEKIRGLKNGI